MSKLGVWSLNRFLFNFSYIGTHFSGVARQPNQHTVSNVIENTLEQLTSECELKSNFFVSSRTDAGVHALANTAHCDLLTHPDGQANLQKSLNSLLIKNNHSIRINGLVKVDEGFVSRHAKSRTYFYRLGLIKDGKRLLNDYNNTQKVEAALYPDKKLVHMPHTHFSTANFVNSIEKEFITEIRQPFDYDLFVKALNLYNGQHNFSAFTTGDGRVAMQKDNRCPIKSVRIGVSKAKPQFMDSSIHENDDRYEIIEVEVTAGSFLYKMIRRLVGAAVDVARGAIPLELIDKMMLCPPDFYGPKSTTILRPNGLFLNKVHYNSEYFP